jgi:DNA-binding XRE family transcriptional regulator
VTAVPGNHNKCCGFWEWWVTMAPWTTNEAGIAATLDQVGPRLQRIRTQRGVTLTSLAATTGISKSTLSRLETGQRRPWLLGGGFVAILAGSVYLLVAMDSRARSRSIPSRAGIRLGSYASRAM